MSTLYKTVYSILIFSTLLIASCTYDNKEELFGNGCDTKNINYANFVGAWLVSTGCVGCHSGGPSPDLSSEASIKAAAAQPNFIGSIKHEGPYSPMPKFQPKVDSCSIKKLDAWIAAGTP